MYIYAYVYELCVPKPSNCCPLLLMLLLLNAKNQGSAPQVIVIIIIVVVVVLIIIITIVIIVIIVIIIIIILTGFPVGRATIGWWQKLRQKNRKRSTQKSQEVDITNYKINKKQILVLRKSTASEILKIPPR